MSKKDIIESLSPLEHVRLRPGVYCGDTTTPNQLLLEVFANALDMHTIGFGDFIEVKVSDEKIFVKDYGKGFPIGEKREDGLTTLEAAFSVMNTSGKFSENGLYEGSSLGLNGMGAKIANFLSHWLEVKSCDGKRIESIRFEEGLVVSKNIEPSSSKESWTEVVFNPSEEFFTTTKVDEKYFNKFFNDITSLCPRLTIQFNGEKISHPEGIISLLGSKVGSDFTLVDRPLLIEEKNGSQQLSLGLTYTTNPSATIIPYVNYGLTETGPHITAIKSAITRGVNNWAKENGFLKSNEKNLDGASIQSGMLLVFNLVTTNVSYNAQVKNQIVKVDTSFISTIFAPAFETWLDNNPNTGEMIVQNALLARKQAEAAKKAREKVKKEAFSKKTRFKAMPSKLADCNCKDRKFAELYVTEGDSASGGAKTIRDASTQAVLGLRGKILNCITASSNAILKNAEVIDIIKSLGFSYELRGTELVVDYDPNKLRYGKFIIACDKDDDGSHIQTLILSMLWELVPDMILDGYVYIADPPLYKAEWGTQYKYLSDKRELEEFKKKHANFTLSYFKGLGEASPQELGWMIMNPETRKIHRVEIEDFGLADQIIRDLMGSDSTPKKHFVFGNEITNIM